MKLDVIAFFCGVSAWWLAVFITRWFAGYDILLPRNPDTAFMFWVGIVVGVAAIIIRKIREVSPAHDAEIAELRRNHDALVAAYKDYLTEFRNGGALHDYLNRRGAKV